MTKEKDHIEKQRKRRNTMKGDRKDRKTGLSGGQEGQ